MTADQEPRDKTAGNSTPLGDVWKDLDQRLEQFTASVSAYLREELGIPDEPNEARKRLSEALLVKVLEQVGIHGELPMTRAKFLQIVAERFELLPAAARPSKVQFAKQLDELFQSVEGEEFEDGQDSKLSRELMRIVCESGPDAVTITFNLIENGHINEQVAAATLETLGELWDLDSRNERCRVLVDCLRSPSPTIRNGAIIGLAHLSDPRTVPALESASEIEDDNVLRDVINRIVKRLREANHETPAPEGE